ncbi:hypothetical protein SAMN04488531_0469 [Corynebacterium coyleae]|uniref:DUF1542 domain-containing protein n=1 Tax=Corynebacterium coyleae TaxID=53374 RepID=A0ABX8KWQ1_9CORY|nr:hypothetical protein [Corynebacterium coyleae]MDK8823258.1 DUF1542 domain-containing protein [Corynebacterium coyleae]QXB18912.1 DUF1542 domain-containing protein [Corynebacterium coyleae]UBI09725.1 DUF1542 domain-containing protein [Corynebacterium coyleae]WJY80471.1 hypothetical protein CCOY_09430 [Corynebacterium coyleae]SEB43710.1 hypothetical protein SAMN04488531_0469 [Corynebacterium coyleae]
MLGLLLIVFAIGALIMLPTMGGGGRRQVQSRQQAQISFDDAYADAKRWTDRLGSQVLNLSGNDAASTQAMADASERFNAASAGLADARTPKQAMLARESALEGLHYVNAAREIMGLPAGPALPELEGQRQAGRVTEQRSVRQEDGTVVTASPVATEATPHYYPGGAVAGRPVPAGWYSTAWWAPAMMTGMWAASSMMFYSTMFAGMSGAAAPEAFEAGGLGDAAGAEGMGDMGDMGDMGGGDFGGDMGDFGGGFDFGGFDF